MNAYELADWLQYKSAITDYSCVKEAAKQLRQQADRIAELEKNLDIAIMTTNADADRIAELEKEADRLSAHANELRKVHAERIAELEKTLSIMEGEYPEPTVFAKITEFNSLEEAYKRIAELEKQIAVILEANGRSRP